MILVCNKILRGKIEVEKDVRSSKSWIKTSSGEIGTGPGVQKSKRPLVTCDARFNRLQYGKKSNSVIRTRS